MTFDFELESILKQQEESPTEEQSPVQAQTDDFADQMSEVEKRLEVAQYYRLLLNDSLFQEPTEASLKVEEEVRGFIKSRLGVLLGIKQETSDLFSAEEVETLKELSSIGTEGVQVVKAIVGKVSKKPVLLESRTEKTEPKLKVQPAKPKPALKKAVEAPKKDSPSKPVAKAGNNIKIPNRYKNDPTLKVVNNRIFVQSKNGNGELMWEKDLKSGKIEPILRDVTPVSVAQGIKPMPLPTGDQMRMLLEQQAQKSVQMSDSTSTAVAQQLGASSRGDNNE